jgi:hypothetical protein
VILFVPVVAGLYVKRTGTVEALAAVGAGITALLALQLFNGGRGLGVFSPAMVGLTAAVAATGLFMIVRRRQ